MKVPFIDLRRTNNLVKDDVFPDWQGAVESCEFVGGKSVTRLETHLKSVLGVENFIACANGTDAILVALQALGIGPGHKVALPNFTFWATYEAVAQLGAQAILIDIDPIDLQMSFDEFKVAYDLHRFDAAILVHLYGWCSKNLIEFRSFCRKQSIVLIEDGAQSFGVQFQGKSVYQDASISTLSFYPAKVIGGCMDGGGIATQNLSLAEKCRSLCNHGRSDHYSYQYVGWNSRMSSLNALYLNQMVGRSSEVIESRLQSLRFYQETLGMGSPQCRMISPPSDVQGNGYLSVFQCDGALLEGLVGKLKAQGIGTGRVYPETICMQKPAQSAIQVGGLEVSRAFCKQVMNLPLFFGMNREETCFVMETLIQALGVTSIEKN